MSNRIGTHWIGDDCPGGHGVATEEPRVSEAKPTPEQEAEAFVPETVTADMIYASSAYLTAVFERARRLEGVEQERDAAILAREQAEARLAEKERELELHKKQSKANLKEAIANHERAEQAEARLAEADALLIRAALQRSHDGSQLDADLEAYLMAYRAQTKTARR